MLTHDVLFRYQTCVSDLKEVLNRREELRRGLDIELSSGKGWRSDLSICHNQDYLNNSELKSLYECWNLFSGDLNYPVSHNIFNPMEAYMTINNYYYGPYGYHRFMLISHILKIISLCINLNKDLKSVIEDCKDMVY